MSIHSPLTPPARTEIRSSSFSFHPKDQQARPGSASALSDSLLETPQDLLCPITHEVFRDPVITSSGQVYEREAITSHLEQHKSDPITRLPLRGDQLTPVYLLRTRAAEYRESAAAACVEAASSPGCGEPVRYVRRAVELAGGAGSPGLSSECCAYVARHPSNAYDAQVLEAFARGLRAAGRRDRAANVYGALLHAGLDRSQQCGLLRALLDCWAELPGELDDGALHSLEQFVQAHAGFRWAQVIDLLEAAYSAAAAISLCEHLLFSPAAAARSASAGMVAGAESNGIAAAPDAREARLREVMLKYVQLQLRAVRERQAAADRRLDALEAGGSSTRPEGPRRQGSLIRRGRFRMRRPGWLNRRAVSAAALALATVGAAGLGGHPLLRVLGLFPLVYLIPPDEGEP